MPTRHELDPVSPNNPVFIPRGGHVVTVNSQGAGACRHHEGHAEPGRRHHRARRQAARRPACCWRTPRTWCARSCRRRPPTWRSCSKIAMRDLNSYGIVGVVEPGVNEQQMALYRARARRRRDDGAHRRALSRDAQGRGREGHRGDQGAEELRHAALRRHQVSARRRRRGRAHDLALPHRAGRADRRGLSRRAAAAARRRGRVCRRPEADRGRGPAGADACGRRRDDRPDRARLRAREQREADPAAELDDHAPVPPVRRGAEEDGRARHHGDDAGPSGAARAQPAPLVGRRARGLRDPDPQGDRCRRAGRRRHRRAGGAGRSVSSRCGG